MTGVFVVPVDEGGVVIISNTHTHTKHACVLHAYTHIHDHVCILCLCKMCAVWGIYMGDMCCVKCGMCGWDM